MNRTLSDRESVRACTPCATFIRYCRKSFYIKTSQALRITGFDASGRFLRESISGARYLYMVFFSLRSRGKNKIAILESDMSARSYGLRNSGRK